jgi:putative FmdB family regulatory protein
MPYYQYSCRTCGQSFEKKLPMSQANETQACPCCQSRETRKKLSSFALTGASRAISNPAPRFT